jgi:hypothetical protein
MEIDTIAGVGTGNQLTGSTAVPSGKWYHIAFVHSGSNFTVYVNGTLSGTLSGTVSSSSINTTRLYNYFGASSKGRFGDMHLDEVKLYNKALTQAQVQLDWQSVGIPSGVC